jgi:hypothetical protein
LNIKNKIKRYLVGLSTIAFALFFIAAKNDWGFFGHRKINRMAVFTLPQEVLSFYKKNITYIEAHSVDPDARRYASKHEAVRHYIDLDQWGIYPFDNVPRDFESCLSKYGLFAVVNKLDTTIYRMNIAQDSVYLMKDNNIVVGFKKTRWRGFFKYYFLTQYYEDEKSIPVDSFEQSLNVFLPGEKMIFIDSFSEHGILPFHLANHTDRLTKAFADRDVEAILRLSAELGHYIGDAHVPLHTTKNYNGQLTDQIGIHAFWESRLPELFADKEYDFFAGKATYISDIQSFAWKIVLESHILLPQVLEGEKELSRKYDSDKQFCYEERLGVTARNYCQEYARAYQDKLDKMVENRMSSSIQAIGSLWYTAWVNGGQPNLKELLKKGIPKVPEEKIIIDKSIKARDHEN